MDKEREKEPGTAPEDAAAPWPGAGELAGVPTGNEAVSDDSAGAQAPEGTPAGPESAGPTDAQGSETAEGAGPGTLEKAGDELFFEMSEEEQKLAEANERYMRLLADFDNYRKRVKRENVIIRQSAKEEIVLDLLPVIDNLERAVTAGKDGSENGLREGEASVLKGVELTLRMFLNVLERFGVERIRCVGEKFDPTRHEALGHVESEDAEQETVAEEILPGYGMSGKVIRAAQVNVAVPKPRSADNG